MKTNDERTEGKFADEAVNALPDAKQKIVESAGIHVVLALSLADIYGSEAKRLKAKYGSADPRVADAKLRKGVVAEHAKEIVEALVSKRSPLAGFEAPQPKEDKRAASETSAAAKAKTSTPRADSNVKSVSAAKTPAKAASTSKTVTKSKPKAKPKARATPALKRAKPTAKKAPAGKGRSKSK